MAVLHLNHVPTQSADGLKAGLHGKTVVRDPAGELGVIVRKDQHKRVHLPFHRKARNGRDRLFGFTFHHGAVGNRADRHPIITRQSIANRQALRLWQAGAERTIADEHAFGIEMAFAMAGQLAVNAAETAQRGVILPVKIVIGAQRVHPVLGVAGVIHEIVGLVPLTAFRAEHDGVRGGHDFRKRRRSAPVTGSATGHGVDVHQSHRRARGIRISHRHGLTGGVVDAHGIFWPLHGRVSQPRGNGNRFQRRRFHRVHRRIICSHKSSSINWGAHSMQRR